MSARATVTSPPILGAWSRRFDAGSAEHHGNAYEIQIVRSA